MQCAIILPTSHFRVLEIILLLRKLPNPVLLKFAILSELTVPSTYRPHLQLKMVSLTNLVGKVSVGSFLIPAAKVVAGLWFLQSSARLAWKCVKPIRDQIRKCKPRFSSGRVHKFYKLTPSFASGGQPAYCSSCMLFGNVFTISPV